MRIFKLVDAWLQIALIVTGLLCSFVSFQGMFIGYVLVGGWQILSMLIHLFATGLFYPSARRNDYARTILVLLIIGLLTYVVLFVYLAALAVIAPLLAIWYLAICFHENEVLQHKRLIHLK